MSEKENTLPMKVSTYQYTEANTVCLMPKKRSILGTCAKWMMLCAVFLIILSSVGGLFLQHNEQIISLSQWISEHTLACFLFRMNVLGVVYFSWPFYIRKRAKRAGWSEITTKQVIHHRYWFVLGLLAVDIMINL